jgi:hypothetical protein
MSQTAGFAAGSWIVRQTAGRQLRVGIVAKSSKKRHSPEQFPRCDVSCFVSTEVK